MITYEQLEQAIRDVSSVNLNSSVLQSGCYVHRNSALAAIEKAVNAEAQAVANLPTLDVLEAAVAQPPSAETLAEVAAFEKRLDAARKTRTVSESPKCERCGKTSTLEQLDEAGLGSLAIAAACQHGYEIGVKDGELIDQQCQQWRILAAELAAVVMEGGPSTNYHRILVDRHRAVPLAESILRLAEDAK